ncbi:DUF1871 family protein [Anaerobacillus alkaliphilus]|uniref:DUF1871 family protein n=1 Tax=Anaerobacillus alkaliphilus TaxID=1548597 RepID=A0A4Q0VPB8_9BACI|nr:DUF1871 family protein [Anaerobacillus alkaliphilus]
MFITKEELKIKYNNQFKLVKEFVNDWDPIGLLPAAPDDEYEFEIARIVTLLRQAKSPEALATGIASIFTKAFGQDFGKEDCLQVAKKIMGETTISDRKR